MLKKKKTCKEFDHKHIKLWVDQLSGETLFFRLFYLFVEFMNNKAYSSRNRSFTIKKMKKKKSSRN